MLPIVSRDQAQRVEGVVTLERLMQSMMRTRSAVADPDLVAMKDPIT